MAIDSTVAGDSANSYVSLAEADAYFAESFGRTAWASSGDKESLLVSASKYLDMFLTWDGVKATDEQSMEWPRKFAYDKTRREYSSSIIPMPVKFATYELAYYMLVNGDLSFEEQTIDRVKVGTVDVSFTEMSTDSGIPKFVEAIVSHISSTVLPSGRSIRSVPLERV